MLFGFRAPRRVPPLPRPVFRGFAPGTLLERIEMRFAELAVALLAWLAILALLFLAGRAW